MACFVLIYLVEPRRYIDTFMTRSKQGCSASKIGSDGRCHAQSAAAAAGAAAMPQVRGLKRCAALSGADIAEEDPTAW